MPNFGYFLAENGHHVVDGEAELEGLKVGHAQKVAGKA